MLSDPLHLDDEFSGIWKGVTISEIEKKLKANPNAKMLALTNCTFDGYIHDSSEIIERVTRVLKDLKKKGKRTADPNDFIFLFDEAWFAYAAFLPRARRLTAMAASKKFPEARIYAVQSTHKTLTSFRQGSMIHVSDNRMTKMKSHMFKEAFLTHTTTSPSYNMIASLDAGRMHADMEARPLWTEAWGLALQFRNHVNRDQNGVSDFFRILTAEDMECVTLPDADEPLYKSDEDSQESNESEDGDEIRNGDQFFYDESKMTLLLKKISGLNGEQAREILLRDYNIHFNKFTNDSCLLMVNGGSTRSSMAHLWKSLDSICNEIRENSDAAALEQEHADGDESNATQSKFEIEIDKKFLEVKFFDQSKTPRAAKPRMRSRTVYASSISVSFQRDTIANSNSTP